MKYTNDHPHHTQSPADQKAYWDAEAADVERWAAERKAEVALAEKRGNSWLWGDSTGRTINSRGAYSGDVWTETKA